MKSDCVRKGTEGAPKRALFHALGMTEEELNRPLVGIVNSYNEIVPGHMNLDKITEAVKIGVAMGGGTPVVFPAIAVCDGIAMGHQDVYKRQINSSITHKHMKSALLAAAWNADSWTFEALEAHYRTLVRYLQMDDQGMVLGKGCGTPSMTAHSRYPQLAYELGRSLT